MRTHRVPLPPFERRVYPPSHEPTRRWLTGGLPPPEREFDGSGRCDLCGHTVRFTLTLTHVEGSSAVRLPEPHSCGANT